MQVCWVQSGDCLGLDKCLIEAQARPELKLTRYHPKCPPCSLCINNIITYCVGAQTVCLLSVQAEHSGHYNKLAIFPILGLHPDLLLTAIAM